MPGATIGANYDPTKGARVTIKAIAQTGIYVAGSMPIAAATCRCSVVFIAPLPFPPTFANALLSPTIKLPVHTVLHRTVATQPPLRT